MAGRGGRGGGGGGERGSQWGCRRRRGAAGAVKKRDEEIKELKASAKASAAAMRGKDKRIARVEEMLEENSEITAEPRRKRKMLGQRLRHHEGPSAPGVKNWADRENGKAAKKREAEKGAAGGASPGRSRAAGRAGARTV